MAKHEHCGCLHEAVTFCATCRVCHCAACGKEWRERPAATSWVTTSGSTGYSYKTADLVANQRYMGGSTTTLTGTPMCQHGSS